MTQKFYAITISPPTRNFNEVYQCRQDFYTLRTLKRYTNHYILIPELTFTMRLHYHGIIQSSLTNIIKIKAYLRRRFGHILIKLIKTPLEHLRYLTYCKKDWCENQYIFDNILTPYTVKKWQIKRKRKSRWGSEVRDEASASVAGLRSRSRPLLPILKQ